MASVSSRHVLRTVTGLEVPWFLYSTTWKEHRTRELVVQAVLVGLRGIDTDCQPKHYREDLVGEAIKRLQAEHGIPREQLYIQTKFTNADLQDPQATPYDRDARLQEQVRQSFAKSLENLCTDYVDSLLMHGHMHSHSANMEVWRTFEEFHSRGQAKQLGLCKLHDSRELAKIHKEANVKPTVIQNQFSAKLQYDAGIRRFCEQNAMVYRSIVNPRIGNSRTIHELAKERGVRRDQVFFRFLIDLGIASTVGTSNETIMGISLAVLEMPALSDSEILAIKQELGIR